MTKLQALEKTVMELNGDEFTAFARWFEQLQEERFDRKIAGDVDGGALDDMAEKALSDFRAGRARPL